ncbi:hypothetical protein ACH4S8_18090 [Streptomyces sp. NPDC021080]|uniref:hypothetical protein n=1 Tax=Streptomyces sp. NPDC021080 TaxID=3365110 RepID=UPI0037BDCD95
MKASKVLAIAALTVTAVGLVAPMASASNESSWTYGCRGYWYSTSGHGYCSHSYSPNDSYVVTYDCNNELDHQSFPNVRYNTTGKISTYECTFKINKTRVTV